MDLCLYLKLRFAEKKKQINRIIIFFLGNFVRKILQPAFHLIASEEDNRIPETTGHGFSHFSETSVKQGISVSRVSADKALGENWILNSQRLEGPGSVRQSSPDLSFLVVKNSRGEKHLFVDTGK